MKSIVAGFFCIFFTLSHCLANAIEPMKNLEIKLKLDQDKWISLKEQLSPFYSETIHQKDTYFVTKQGRLKLREEEGKNAYMIRYDRPDLEEAKQSDYLFYAIHDVELFISVFGDSLKEELQVKKERALFFPKPHIRVHLDKVEGLGDFLEIEIVLSNQISKETAETEMKLLQDWLQLTGLKKITHGYRELLKESQLPLVRDFNYYKIQNKIFWVIAHDFTTCNFKRYDVIPCIFVELFNDGTYGIIQLDPSIAHDGYQYTAWRKLLGQEHGFRAEVLLIDAVTDKLYNLKGEEVYFESLTRSPRFIDKSYLAPFSKVR